MKVEHFILAQNSSVDRDTNQMSVFCFLEDLNVQPQGDTVPFGAQAIIVLKRDQEPGALAGQVTFSVISPDNQRLVSTQVPFQFREDHIRQRIRVNFQFALTSSGNYTFVAEGQDEMPARVEQCIRIHILDPNQADSPKGQSLN